MMAEQKEKVELEYSQSEIVRHIESLGVETDFNILCGRKIYKVHRALMAPASNLLFKLFVEQQEGSFSLILDPIGIKPEDVENILRYIYIGQVQMNSNELKDGFLKLGRKLEIAGLYERTCDATIQEQVQIQEDKVSKKNQNAVKLAVTASSDALPSLSSFNVRNCNPKEQTIFKIPQETLPLQRRAPKMTFRPRELTPYKKPDDLSYSPSFSIMGKLVDLSGINQTSNLQWQSFFANDKEKEVYGEATFTFSKNQSQMKNVTRTIKTPEMITLEQILGHPILSSTKLNPIRPCVPDKTEKIREKFKSKFKENARLIETAVDLDLDVVKRTKEDGGGKDKKNKIEGKSNCGSGGEAKIEITKAKVNGKDLVVEKNQEKRLLECLEQEGKIIQKLKPKDLVKMVTIDEVGAVKGNNKGESRERELKKKNEKSKGEVSGIPLAPSTFSIMDLVEKMDKKKDECKVGTVEMKAKEGKIRTLEIQVETGESLAEVVSESGLTSDYAACSEENTTESKILKPEETKGAEGTEVEVLKCLSFKRPRTPRIIKKKFGLGFLEKKNLGGRGTIIKPFLQIQSQYKGDESTLGPSEPNEFEKIRCLNKERNAKLVKATDDDSSDEEIEFGLRTKIPVGKRRRKPALVRLEIPDLTTSISSASASPHPKRPKTKYIKKQKNKA